MNHQCKYHPLEPAQWYCSRCVIALCDTCSPESPGADAGTPHYCHCCGGELQGLGGATAAVPLWQRLPDAFGFPLSLYPMLFLLLAFVAAFFFPPGLLAFAGAAAVMLVVSRYAYAVLETSVQGATRPPELTLLGKSDSHGNAVQMFLLYVIGAGATVAAWRFMPALGALVALVMLFYVSAAIVVLSVEKDVTNAVNPSYAVNYVVRALMVPFATVYLFLLLVMASSALVVSLFADVLPEKATWSLVVLAGSYFVLVASHLLGYLVFQYQTQLGITVGQTQRKARRGDPVQAQMELYLKEGMYAKAAGLLKNEVSKKGSNLTAHERYSKLLFALNDQEALAQHANTYFKALLEASRDSQAVTLLKAYMERMPGFRPDDPDVRLDLAVAFDQLREYKLAVHVLNGMHKDSANYVRLPESYLLAARVLNDNLKLPQKAMALVLFLDGRYKTHKLYPEIQSFRRKLNNEAAPG